MDSTEVESAESIADVQTSWTLPTINVSSAPKAIYTGTPLINRDYPENYFRSAKWYVVCWGILEEFLFPAY